jgi:hypothetical protein
LDVRTIAAEPNICPQYAKTYADGEVLDPEVPKPDKCVMKRKDELLNFSPNFPVGRPDVYIEVELGTGERFQFYPHDFPGFDAEGEIVDNDDKKKKKRRSSMGSIPIVDKDVYQKLFDEQEKLGGQGFKLRYVSKNGPGEWNSCKYSPIAFDLNMNGEVEIITDAGGYKIDITGDGEIEHLKQWFAPSAGILIDAHNDEDIEGDFKDVVISGKDMMGDMAGKYTDGFAKLATYDINCDDKLTGDELEGLYIWQDKNSDLNLDQDELYELSDFGIVELSTIHDDLKSHAVLSDGSQMLMQDLWFDAYGERRRRRSLRMRN